MFDCTMQVRVYQITQRYGIYMTAPRTTYVNQTGVMQMERELFMSTPAGGTTYNPPLCVSATEDSLIQ